MIYNSLYILRSSVRGVLWWGGAENLDLPGIEKAWIALMLTCMYEHIGASSMQIPERDGDGYLIDMNTWTPEIGRAMAEADEVILDEIKWDQILKARQYFEEHSVVPPIRKFAKYLNADQKEMFKMWMGGPMKPISKYGGLPKPTGCV